MLIEKLLAKNGKFTACGTPKAPDWQNVFQSLGFPMPEKYTDLLSCFGHGVWGTELVLLHPFAARFQKLTLANLIEGSQCIDPDFRSVHMAGDPSKWKCLPVGRLPYRELLLLESKSGNAVLYDGDMCLAVYTNTDLLSFLLKSSNWMTEQLTGDWLQFAQGNWPKGTPLFSNTVRSEPDGLCASFRISVAQTSPNLQTEEL